VKCKRRRNIQKGNRISLRFYKEKNSKNSEETSVTKEGETNKQQAEYGKKRSFKVTREESLIPPDDEKHMKKGE